MSGCVVVNVSLGKPFMLIDNETTGISQERKRFPVSLSINKGEESERHLFYAPLASISLLLALFLSLFPFPTKN